MKIFVAVVVSYLVLMGLLWGVEDTDSVWLRLLHPLILAIPFAFVIGMVAMWYWALDL